MVDKKRKLTFDESSEEENSKKLRNDEFNRIEKLSNEIFFEIFDYLDGLDIYIAFSNLNHRFQQLVKSGSRIQYEINRHFLTTKETFFNQPKEFKQQIYSFYFQLLEHSINEFLPLFIIDCYSYINLQSIIIEDIEKDQLISLLNHLSHLPCLYSLNIKTTDSIEDLTHIYQLIFSLSQLKSNRLLLYGDQCSISLPVATNNQLSSLEYLDIAHWYTFDELSALLSYTPRLRCLNLSNSNWYDFNLEDMSPINLNHLIRLSMYTQYLNFDQFQLFIEKIHSKLKVLHVNFAKRDINFLDADRWQQFLSQNFAQLEKFSLHYREPGLGDDYSIYNGESNQFISPFWMEKNVIFDIEIHEYNIQYFLRPYKTRWYKYMNSSIEYSKSTQLTIKYVYPCEPSDVLLKQITRALNFTQIYHLNIEQQISIETLMQILHLLPDLLTLKINSLSFFGTFPFLNQVFPITSASEHAKNIKYVYLEKALKMKDIHFLLSFCPRMEYLNVECIQNMNIQSFVREILNEINRKHPEYLRLLCIYITTIDDQAVKQLSEMICGEQLLVNYTIHRQLYDIYLTWK